FLSLWPRAALGASVVMLALALTHPAQAQTLVPGNSPDWTGTGTLYPAGTQVTIFASALVSYGPAGWFGPEGSADLVDASDYAASAPKQGLAIRVTSNPTPTDETRQDLSYRSEAQRTYCFQVPGYLWLIANDRNGQYGDNAGGYVVTVSPGSCDVTP